MEVKVVNMEVKPPFVCFTMGWFVDNRLEAHRVDDKKVAQRGKCSDQALATNIKPQKDLRVQSIANA